MRLSLRATMAALPAFTFAQATLADAPQVVTDIPPIHSLVSQVMAGVGAPDLLVEGGASPHDFQFGFDQATAVQEADLVVWMGPALTPWLEESLTNLAPDAPQLVLLDSEGWDPLEARDVAVFGGHDHDDHDDHAEGGNTKLDPHAWLDPQIAQVWVISIAAALSEADPENEALYGSNALATIADLRALEGEVSAILDAAPAGNIIVAHDAFQYFGTRFDRAAIAAIALDDASTPSPNRIEELQDLVTERNVSCVLSDPQTRSEWSDLIREGTDAGTALIDATGGTIETGPQQYRGTLLALATAYADCLSRT